MTKSESEKMSRRSYLTAAGALVAGLAIGGAAGWLGKPAEQISEVITERITQRETVTATVTGAGPVTPTVAPPISWLNPSTYEKYQKFPFSDYTKRAISQLMSPVTKPLAEPKKWTSPPPQYKDKKEIVIGCSIAMTGMFADGGLTIREIDKRWAEKVNAAGGLLGLPVRILLYDDRSDSAQAIANYEKLITVDKVDLLLSGFPTAIMAPVYGAIDKYGKVVFSSGSASTEAATNPGWKNVFNIFMGAEVFGWSFWQWLDSLPEATKPKTAAISYASYSPFTVDGSRGDSEQARALGLDVTLFEGYSADTTDFSSLVQKAAGADVWSHKSTSTDASVLTLRAMRDSGYQPKSMWDMYPVYVGFSDKNRPGHQIPLSDYCFLPVWHWPTWPDPPYKDVREWVDWYTTGANAEIFGPLVCFDYGPPIAAKQILQQCIEATGSLDDAVIKQYAETHSFYTIGGHIEFEDKYHLSIGDTCALAQQTGDGLLSVVWPPHLATGPAAYPRPPWSQYRQS